MVKEIVYLMAIRKQEERKEEVGISTYLSKSHPQ
jgi:hypothetical protein